MQSISHKQHMRQGVTYSCCPECNADRERRFTEPQWVGHRFAHEYLEYAKAGFGGKGVRTWWGGDRLTADEWAREFRAALQRRIYLRVQPERGRKYSPGYLERMLQFRSRQDGRYFADAAYLRTFARKGASAL